MNTSLKVKWPSGCAKLIFLVIYIFLGSGCAPAKTLTDQRIEGSRNDYQIAHRTRNKDASERHSYVYKDTPTRKLELYVYGIRQGNANKAAPTPVVVFFHGGAWARGEPDQFLKQVNFLSRHGLVAITVDYRLKGRDNTSPFEALQDAKSAIRWVRQNAANLNIDPNKLIAAGGSAGGQLAVATAIVDDDNDPQDDLKISAAPDAIILFNPVLDLVKWQKTFNMDLMPISPLQKMNKPLPPTIIFHGTADSIAPFSVTEAFVAKARQLGTKQIELLAYPNRTHGFFNKEGKDKDLSTTLAESYVFIQSLHW